MAIGTLLIMLAAGPVELGGTVGLFFVEGGDGFLFLTAGPRVTVRVADGVSVELMTEAIAPSESDGLYGIYQVQYKQVLTGAPAGKNLFLTIGTAGGFVYDRVKEFREPRRDGAVIVYPAHTRASLSRPMILIGGIGTQRPIASRLAFRADAQGYMFAGFGLRGSIGLSIPIVGRYAH